MEIGPLEFAFEVWSGLFWFLVYIGLAIGPIVVIGLILILIMPKNNTEK